MRKLNFLPIIIFLINLLSIVHSQKNIGLIDGTIGYGDNIGLIDGTIGYGDNIGLIDGTIMYGKNVFLTDSYSPKDDELYKVYILLDGTIGYGDNIGLIDGTIGYGDNIGLIDGTIGYGDNYGFTSRPESSDIIIVVDLDLITKILSGHSVLGTILKNYNSSTKKIVKTIDGEVKVFDDSQSIEELMITDITDDGEIIFLSNGSIYEVIYESYKTTLWLSYSNVFLIDDKKIIKDGDEVKVRKIDEKIKKSSIRRISDDKNYIYLYDGTVYYTIDISVYLWFEDNFVMVIGDTQLINEFNRDRINVIRVE